jgi:hypothetical protein
VRKQCRDKPEQVATDDDQSMSLPLARCGHERRRWSSDHGRCFVRAKSVPRPDELEGHAAAP